MTESADSEASICVGCGLCCDGTLFVRGKLTPEEASRTDAAHKFAAGPKGDEISFRQPCIHFDGSACRIYSDRYATCREYQCELLKAHMDGSVDSFAARARIARARELIAMVTVGDPDARTWAVRQKRWAELTDAVKSASGAERGVLGRRLLNIVALETFLDRHFRKKAAEPASR